MFDTVRLDIGFLVVSQLLRQVTAVRLTTRFLTRKFRAAAS
jgi:hypothetical protein